MSEKETDPVFVCPGCNAPHFGSSKKPGEVRIYRCHGNEWKKTPSCGYEGPFEDCFKEMTRPEYLQFQKDNGVEEFFKSCG